jgi:ribonuclease HI
MTITAAVDGSALGNPGPAGWAWVVSPDAWAAGGFDRATNNIGELMALVRLLEDTAAAGFEDEPLVVLADSQYVINSVTKWMPGWKRRGWKKADGKPVMNRELLERIDKAMKGRDVRFEWVKGHAGHDMNEAADLRARAAAEAHKTGSGRADGTRVH